MLKDIPTKYVSSFHDKPQIIQSKLIVVQTCLSLDS